MNKKTKKAMNRQIETATDMLGLGILSGVAGGVGATGLTATTLRGTTAIAGVGVLKKTMKRNKLM